MTETWHTEPASDWVDYASTSTIIGWSAYTTQHLYYKRVGDLLIVLFNFVGTSNSATTSFTLPYTAANVQGQGAIRCSDDGSAAALGRCLVTIGSSTVTSYFGLGTTGWTASGGKTVGSLGALVYQIDDT